MSCLHYSRESHVGESVGNGDWVYFGEVESYRLLLACVDSFLQSLFLIFGRCEEQEFGCCHISCIVRDIDDYLHVFLLSLTC